MTEPQALVVGGSSDIGRAIAAELAELGYALTLWGRNESRLEAAAAACPASAEVITDRVDVTDRAALAAAVDAVVARGGLTVLVWAAGLFDWAPADEASVEAWHDVFDVNLVAAAATTRQLLPALIAAAPSAVVYIGSGASRQAYANNAAYVASKHGLAGLASSVFLDVRDRDVKVSLVSPGQVAAGASLLSPAARTSPHTLLQPTDVASAVRFVVTFPERGCPVEISIQPQHTPR